MAEGRVRVPVPVLLKPKLPLTTPESVSAVPATSTVLSARSVTVPLWLLVPVLAWSVPPLRVNASAPMAMFCKSSVAPLLTVLPAALVPSALALVATRVPPLTVVTPV